MSITEYIKSTDTKERESFEAFVYENVYHIFAKQLPDHPGESEAWYFCPMDIIICETEDTARRIGRIINKISGRRRSRINYYDPEICSNFLAGSWSVDYSSLS